MTTKSKTKSETIHVSEEYHATNQSEAELTFRMALSSLNAAAFRANKIVLWDTLQSDIIRNYGELISLTSKVPEIFEAQTFLHLSVTAYEA